MSNQIHTEDLKSLFVILSDNKLMPVYRKTKDGNLLYVSDLYCRVNGIQQNNKKGWGVIKLNKFNLFESIEDVPSIFKSEYHECILKTGKPILEEVEYDLPEIGKRKFNLYHVPVYNLRGKIIGSQGFLTETHTDTQSKPTNQFKKGEAIYFKYLIENRISNPIHSFLGFSELISKPEVTPSERDVYINTMRRGAQELLKLVENLHKISLMKSGNERLTISAVNPDVVCEAMLESFWNDAVTAGLDFQFKKPNKYKGVIKLETDERKLRWILHELIENALKYTHSGYVYFGYDYMPNGIYFFVEDSGIGIPEKKKKFVFERFSLDEEELLTEKNGLGLSIAKEYMQIMGGKIWMESTLGKGSYFYLSLPLHPRKE
jgi:hypothetical protein